MYLDAGFWIVNFKMKKMSQLLIILLASLP